MSISVDSAIGEITWATNGSGMGGTFIDGGPGRNWAKYTFTPDNNGQIILFVMDDTSETINLDVIDNFYSATDTDFEGDVIINPSPGHVFNTNQKIWYTNIQDALTEASNNNHIWIFSTKTFSKGDISSGWYTQI